MSSRIVKLIWIGNERGLLGLPNIPGRDLSKEEVDKYGGEKFLVDTGLYVTGSGKKMSVDKQQPPRRE